MRAGGTALYGAPPLTGGAVLLPVPVMANCVWLLPSGPVTLIDTLPLTAVGDCGANVIGTWTDSPLLRLGGMATREAAGHR